MKIVVVGGGKVGFYLAKTLIEHGHETSVLEMDKELCAELANSLDIPIIHADGTKIEGLLSADIESADALIGVTGKDESNLIACQLAKKLFKVPKTIAKVNNPKNAAAMKELGVDITISSTANIVFMLEREVDTAAIKHLVALNGGESSINEIQLPEQYKLHGKTLMELKLPEQSVIISITRNGRLIIPRGNTEIHSGDKILALVANAFAHKLKEAMMLES